MHITVQFLPRVVKFRQSDLNTFIVQRQSTLQISRVTIVRVSDFIGEIQL